MLNGSVTKSDLENKYVFWDIDGTLAPYRFNNHVADPGRTNKWYENIWETMLRIPCRYFVKSTVLSDQKNTKNYILNMYQLKIKNRRRIKHE